jgi:hypothetical protein
MIPPQAIVDGQVVSADVAAFTPSDADVVRDTCQCGNDARAPRTGGGTRM